MLVFVGIALVGLFFLGVSALFGGSHDVGEHEFSFEQGYGTDADHALGGGPSPFSLRIISLFVTAFGAVGAIARYYNASYMASSVVGVAGGFAVGAIGWRLMKLFWEQQATSTVSVDELLGVIGEVKTAIPASGVGQVSVVVKSQRLYSLARSKDGRPIEEGVLVKIVAHPGDAVIVERV